jgi:hypothetical protein
MPTDPATAKIYCRFDYLHVHKPFEGELNKGNPKYKVTCLIDPKDPRGKASWASVQAATKHVGMEVFGNWPQTWKDSKRFCVSDGDSHTITDKKTQEEVTKEAYKGMKVITASNKNRPICVAADGRTPLVPEDNEPISGDYGWVVVRFYGTKDAAKGGKGLFAGFEAIQKIKDGEPLGGGGSRVRAEDVFTDESEAPEDEA